jgi:hypothetical protein
MPNSSMLVLPSTTAPAARRRDTAVASKGGWYPASTRLPAVVATPAVHRLSCWVAVVAVVVVCVRVCGGRGVRGGGVRTMTEARQRNRHSQQAERGVAALQRAPPSAGLP